MAPAMDRTMDDREIARYWDDNAEAWTRLSRAGYDVYRDGLNTPAFLAMLPDVRGRVGLDVGCGEGHNTRLLAARGADMTGIDVSRVFLQHALAAERLDPLAIDFVHASAAHLPCPDGTFDFVTALMSLMDMPGLERVLAEIHRVLRPGGFLQASIEHPCFATPHRRNLRDANRRTYALEVGDYFRRLEGTLAEWTFSAAPAEVRDGVAPFRIPRFNRPLGQWINLLIDSGFVIERLEEPRPDDDAVRAYPKLQCAQVVAYFLHIRVRKI
jgi:ubiquinone/menaquinone biosynthesis C-methylase UbiE